jgi:hypothetical protein
MSFESFVRLGWAYARVMARKLLGSSNEIDRFVQQYQPDGIVLFEPSDPDVLAGASRCIACGRCDTEARLRDTFTALGARGPMAFVLGVSRHSGKHDAAEISAAATPEQLEALTGVCPVEVPFVRLVALVRRRQQTLASVRGAAIQIRGT